MGRRELSPLEDKLTYFINKLSIHRRNISPSTSFPARNDSSDSDRPSTWAKTNGPEDEGFHEEWLPFSPKDLHELMSSEQAAVFVKEWLSYFPTSVIAEVEDECIKPRLHKDFVKLKYEVLSYLDVDDLVRCMPVSTAWSQICSYPLLWKRLYLEKGWTIAEEVMFDFETQLHQIQLQFDLQHSRYCRSMLSNDNDDNLSLPLSDHESSIQSDSSSRASPYQMRILYDQFFTNLNLPPTKGKSLSSATELRQNFRTIARHEIDGPSFRTATFTFNNNGTIRVHVDWRYLYVNRKLLEDNWRGGRYQATILDGAPDIIEHTQREGIYCVNFDRNILAAGSRDKMIRLWSMHDHRYLRSLQSHEGSVLCLQLDSKRGTLVSGSSDSTIKIWDLRDGKVIQTLRGHAESVLGLHMDNQYIVSCSKDTTARIWHISEDHTQTADSLNPNGDDICPESSSRYVLQHTLRGHCAAVNSVHFQGNVIATASGDRTIRLWSLVTGNILRTIGTHPRGIACVNLAQGFVVTGSSDHVIRIFDAMTGAEVRTLRGHTGLVRTIQTDNTKIISGSYDQSIRIWDLTSGEMLQELRNGHDSKYLSVLRSLTDNRIFRVHRDQRRIISCCGNARIVVWDFAGNSSLSRSSGSRSPLIDATFF